MGALILNSPPDNFNWWIPPNAIPGVEILYTPGRNTKLSDGRWSYHIRKHRDGCFTEIFHEMGGSSTESMQGFANSEMGTSATLAELATFVDGKVLQSLPLNIIGAGSVAGCATGITNESASLEGDPNTARLTDTQLITKAKLTAWLINNPLRWPNFKIPYQICRSPTAPSAPYGGLGDHTMWGICGTSAGGSNPWSLYCKSCPGWYKRGTQRNIQFPNSLVTDIPWAKGNFRDYYELVGSLLVTLPPPPLPTTTEIEEEMLFQVRVSDVANAGVFPHLYLVVGGKCYWVRNDADSDVAELSAKFGTKLFLSFTNGKALLDTFQVPVGERPPQLV